MWKGSCAVFAVLAGCGSSDSGSSTCSWGGACGGDIVGVWSYTSECVLGTFTSSSCPGESISASGRPTGSLTFAADGSLSGSVTTVVHESVSYPGSCLSGYSDCSAVADALKGQFTVPVTISCSGSVSTSCSCSVDLTVSSVGSGTYAVSGNSVTVTETSGTVTTSTYCVHDNALSTNTPHSDGTETVTSFTRTSK